MRTSSKIVKMMLMLAVSVLCAGVSLRAQEAGGPPPPGPGHRGPHPFEDFGFLGFEAGIGGKTVTGAPFSAAITTQSTQLLSDGNQIQRSTTGSFARDSQGRTRREMTLPGIGPMAAAAGGATPHAVFINDPVAGKSYVLRADDKTAEVMPSPAHGGPGKNGGPDAEFKKRFQNEETTTELGAQTINGVSAQGTRMTRTIPAGEIGNVKPIVITVERWYSAELQTYVMVKRTDPMMGDSTYQLTNIQRQEPEAALFQVPADYTVSQGGARGGPRSGGRPDAQQ